MTLPALGEFEFEVIQAHRHTDDGTEIERNPQRISCCVDFDEASRTANNGDREHGKGKTQAIKNIAA